MFPSTQHTMGRWTGKKTVIVKIHQGSKAQTFFFFFSPSPLPSDSLFLPPSIPPNFLCFYIPF